MFWMLLLVLVLVVLGVREVVEWAKPISAKKSVPLGYTREVRVAAAIRAAESDARWERMVQYSHWLEDGNPICRMHEASYARMLAKSRQAEWVRMLGDGDGGNAMEMRRTMLNLKCANPEEYTRICKLALA